MTSHERDTDCLSNSGRSHVIKLLKTTLKVYKRLRLLSINAITRSISHIPNEIVFDKKQTTFSICFDWRFTTKLIQNALVLFGAVIWAPIFRSQFILAPARVAHAVWRQIKIIILAHNAVIKILVRVSNTYTIHLT